MLCQESQEPEKSPSSKTLPRPGGPQARGPLPSGGASVERIATKWPLGDGSLFALAGTEERISISSPWLPFLRSIGLHTNDAKRETRTVRALTAVVCIRAFVSSLFLAFFPLELTFSQEEHICMSSPWLPFLRTIGLRTIDAKRKRASGTRVDGCRCVRAGCCVVIFISLHSKNHSLTKNTSVFFSSVDFFTAPLACARLTPRGNRETVRVERCRLCSCTYFVVVSCFFPCTRRTIRKNTMSLCCILTLGLALSHTLIVHTGAHCLLSLCLSLCLSVSVSISAVSISVSVSLSYLHAHTQLNEAIDSAGPTARPCAAGNAPQGVCVCACVYVFVCVCVCACG